ncbi:MAG: glutamine-hydrolyzing carbamoyl-phosphate synthase small subunit [Gammaproteobacteria bacterium]|nr:glutamine-hydrolyzing carbamoyl-phosphate synthase small subunit [Gammaproteobacteria bacterium]
MLETSLDYQQAVLVLEDGTAFKGIAIGAIGETVGEVVFNTSMTGYQEILTDPSYKKQIVTLTYPHIGNTGVNHEDEESEEIFLSGFVIKNLPLLASNWRSEENLSEYLKRHNIVAIANIDTRKLTRLLTQKGAQKGCIIALAEGEEISDAVIQSGIEQAQAFAGLQGMDLAKEVTTKESYQWTEPSWQLNPEEAHSTQDSKFNVVAYDFGVKRNILRLLVDQGCNITVVPAQTSAEDVLALNPDGVFLSNGPGDPEPCAYAIKAISQLLDKNIPLFGICLGHQLLSLASGAKTKKMKFGHHGANHPVLDIDSQVVAITSQNHGFAVDETSLPECLKMTHKSLFDQSLQGVHRTDKPAFGFQGHPEASPGPHDIQPLFEHFIELMQ